MIIQGFAYACESSVFMVFAIVIALMVPLLIFSPTVFGGYILSFYGIALVGLGLLTTTGYVLAMDTFGPISDNAQGVYEMSGDGHDNEYGMKAVGRLDAAGNTTKALTKGFAITTAVVAAVALFHSYLESAHLDTIGLRLDVPEIFLGMLIGAAAPYLFSASTINAVGRASFQLINEVRRQFREDPGIMAGTSKPDYARCVAIVTAAAQKELLGPGILAIGLPIAVAFGFSIGKQPVNLGGHLYNLTGAEALGGFLAGAIASGQLMAVLLANSGGMWDNAKKLIEDGLYGGKGSEAHKAGVVCDTVGDPFKDTAGPAMNPLIKVMNLVALLLAPVVVLPLGNSTLVLITLVAVGALAVSIAISKKGSMSSEMALAKQSEGAIPSEAAALPESAPAPIKKKLTVEEPADEDSKSE
jgi:K(+)-stimulated pyrophosphate-energized sodium pump